MGVEGDTRTHVQQKGATHGTMIGITVAQPGKTRFLRLLESGR